MTAGRISRFISGFAAFGLLSCGPGAGLASTPTDASEVCSASDAAAGNLRMVRLDAISVAPVRSDISIRSRSAIALTGPCASGVIAADGGSFLLKDRTVVGLTAPLQLPSAKLEAQHSRSPFDRIKVVRGTGRNDRDLGRLLVMTDAVDPAAGVDRFAAVWKHGRSATVGFVDIDRADSKRTNLPLFQLPSDASIAYYQPSPDTNAGQMTVLAHAGDSALVYWIDVGI